MTRLFVLIAAVWLVSCGSRPDIRYYQLKVDQTAILRADDSTPRVVFAVEAMIGDSAYEDPRIVYRVSPYRLDYYHYHRWTAPPGVMLSDFLRDAYEQTGYFDSVVAGFSPDASVFLYGRLVAFEEVDVEKDSWLARIKINLALREAATGDVIWNRTITEEVSVTDRTPEGVAAAMSAAATRIVADTAPEFARLAANAHERSRRRRSRDSAMDSLQPGDAP